MGKLAPLLTIPGRAVAAAAVFVGLLILFGFLGTWLPAADSVAHFRFHLAVLAALASAVLALARRWRVAGFTASCAVAGVIGMGTALPDWGVAVAANSPPSVKLVQLNLSFWNREPEAVAAFIRREQADIVTFQEVTTQSGRVIDLLAEDYPFRIRCPFSRVGGSAVLSRLPPAPGAAKGCADGRGLGWLRVMVDGTPLSVASLHLHWPWPFRQPAQLDQLMKYFAAIPKPAIVAGDFNSAPWSHSVARVASATGTTVAPGLRFSFNISFNDWMPRVPIPIDHVLLPLGVRPVDVRLGPGPGSDHRSVVATLALTPANKEVSPGT